MLKPCVVDTDVLHHANQTIRAADLPHREKLSRRLALLTQISHEKRVVLTSKALLDQYSQHLRKPFNDYVQQFLDAATRPAANVRSNWAILSGSQRDRAHRTCRFPREDMLLLRTAYGENAVIFSEENRVVRTDACIHKYFQVHAKDPTA